MRLNVRLAQCPLCHLSYIPDPSKLPTATGDYCCVACPRCGRYVVSGTMDALYKRNEPDEQRLRMSCAVRERSINGLESKLLRNTTLESLLLAPWPGTPAAKAERLLANLVKMTPYPGANIDLTPSWDSVLAFTTIPEEMTHYLHELEEAGYIRLTAQDSNVVKAKLTNMGFEHAQITAVKLAEPRIGPDLMQTDQQGKAMSIVIERKIDQRRIFLVHGRNKKAHDQMMVFLRSLDLDPWDFDRAVGSIPHGSPHIGDVLKWAFENTSCVLVLITGDDDAKLKEELWLPDEKADEKKVQPQPRLNVVFEAGRAIALNETKTVLVQVGKSKAFSDIQGRYLHHFNGSPDERKKLKEVLQSAGCAVQESGDWLYAGDFSALARPLGPGTIPLEQPISADDLSTEEKELILASGQEGNFLILSVDSALRNWVCAGATHFMKEDDPLYTARYMEALEGLKTKKLVTQQSEKAYLLTVAGFKVQAQLKKENSKNY